MRHIQIFENYSAPDVPDRYVCENPGCVVFQNKVGLYSQRPCPGCRRSVRKALSGEFIQRPFNPNPTKDFSRSKIKDTVWHVGEIKDSPMGGGIWFAETKEGAENFSISVRGKAENAQGYKINLVNPYFEDHGFWRGYIEKIGWDPSGRLRLMKELESQGYDGIVIDTDTWNDTGDEYAVTSKQYVVFDPADIKKA